MKLIKDLYKYYNHHNAQILFSLTILGCIVPNILLSITEPESLPARIVNTLLPLGLYTCLLSLSRKIARTVLWFFPIIFFAAFQIVQLWLYGESAVSVDMLLNVVTTNSTEVKELLGNMIAALSIVVVLYVPPLTLAVTGCLKRYRLPEQFRNRGLKLGIATTIASIPFLLWAYKASASYDFKKDIYPINVGYNITVAFDRSSDLRNYAQSSARFTFQASKEEASDSTRKEVYVMIVGETSRACNWQLLGYQRPTTPNLLAESNLISYRNTYSQTNVTHKSVPMLLSHLDARNFGDSIFSSKSIITAFKEAGFHTAFFSNQRRNGALIDLFGQEADTCVFIKDAVALTAPDPYDSDLLPLIKQEINGPHRRSLIVVHTYGSHFCYNMRYPQENAIFTPDDCSSTKSKARPSLLNAYDNTIAYTDRLIHNIISSLSSPDIVASVIYTSDHGEDIYDNNSNHFLHASPRPTHYQLHVPMLLWFSQSYTALHPQAIANARANADKYVASSASFFHTTMQIAGIVSPKLIQSLSLISPTYAYEAPLFLDDYNEPTPLDPHKYLHCTTPHK